MDADTPAPEAAPAPEVVPSKTSQKSKTDQSKIETRSTKYAHSTWVPEQTKVVNDEKDFFICAGIALIIAVVCAIGIVIIHFTILSKPGGLLAPFVPPK